MKYRVLTLVLAVALCSGAVSAATINVTDWAGVVAAFPAAGDTVEFAAGTYTVTGQVELFSDVTYQGAGEGLTIIDGGGSERAFTSWGDRSVNDGVTDPPPNTTGPNDWVIDGMTFQNCQADENDRDYDETTSTVTFPDEDQDGGAVNIDNGSTGTISNCSFLNNDAPVDDGGGVAMDGGATVMTVENCLFEGNTCGDDAGALRVQGDNTNVTPPQGSQATVTNCTFTGNNAGDDAGPISFCPETGVAG